MDSAARHRCMIYSGSPEKQLPYLATLILDQLRGGARCLYLNSPAMVEGMQAHLAVAGVDVDKEVGKGALVFSTDQSHIIDGRFDPAAMLRSITTFIARAHADGYEKLWASGDMTYEFGDQCNLPLLLQYERALEHMLHLHPGLSVVCQYHQDTLPTSSLRDALSSHQSVYINQTLFRLNPYYTEGTPKADIHIPTDVKDLLERFSQHQ